MASPVGNVDLTATNTSSIRAAIVSASTAVTVSGAFALSGSIGVALARNLVGWDLGTHNTTVPDTAESQAYLLDSSVYAAGDLNLTADADQSIDALVQMSAA